MAYCKKNSGSVGIRTLPVFFALLSTTAGCGIFSTRPARHLSYAETAYVAAQKAEAETKSPQSFQLARETLFRARAAYRLKNFKEARRMAIRARMLSEEAEFRSLHKDSTTKENPVTNPEE